MGKRVAGSNDSPGEERTRVGCIRQLTDKPEMYPGKVERSREKEGNSPLNTSVLHPFLF
jgi:hypothetical protein